MADGWDSWGSCMDDNGQSGWEADVVLNTASLNYNTSHDTRRSRNKSRSRENHNPNNNRNERNKDSNNYNRSRPNSEVRGDRKQNNPPHDRTNQEGTKGNFNPPSRSTQHGTHNKHQNNKPVKNEYKRMTIRGNRHKSSDRDSTHNYRNQGARFNKSNTDSVRNEYSSGKYNSYGNAGVSGSQNEMHKTSKGKNHTEDFKNKRFEPPPTMKNGRSTPYERFQNIVGSNKEYGDSSSSSRRGSRDSQQENKNNWNIKNPPPLMNQGGFNPKMNNRENNRNNQTKSQEMKEKQNIQNFEDPPELFTFEDKSNQMNYFEDVKSSQLSFASKSESVLSSDQNEVEMKILNLIHEFKTTLHSVEIKPSVHVQTEIKGLQKYISLIFEKWNPKAREENNSSESDSTEDTNSSDEEMKGKGKKNRRNRQKKKTRKQSKKEDTVTTDDCGEKSVGNNSGNQNQPGPNKVTQFQENSAHHLNQPMAPGPVNFIPPIFPMYPNNTPPPNYPGLYPPPLPPLLANPPTFHLNWVQNNGPPPKLPFTPPKTKNKQIIPTPKIPNNVSDVNARSDTNLSKPVLNIVNDIYASGVTLTKAHIKEIRAALNKLSSDNSNLSSTELSEDFKNINVCMIRVVDNESLSYDVKFAILHLLEEFTKTCDFPEGDTEKLINVYRNALDEMKPHANLDYDLLKDEVFEEFKHISVDRNSFDELCKFKDSAKEEMSQASYSEHQTILDSASASESEHEESDGHSSEEEEEEDQNSGEESDVNESKVESNNVKEDKTKRRKPKVKLTPGLSVTCLSMLRSSENIEQQVNHMLAIHTQVLAESKDIQRNILYQIKDLVKSIYPNCILHLFGSRVSNMALPDSDMDIYIDVTGQNYSDSTTYENQQLFVKKIRKLFYRNSHTFSCILGLTRTKVPIIKLQHKVSAINIDLSFKNGISVENTKLLSYYLSIDPRVKWLVTAVKLWAQYNQLYGSDYFTSHALTWLVLFYLMQKSVVPPIILLRQNVQPRIIDHWNVAFKKQNDWTPNTDLSNLLLFQDFFSFVIVEDFTTNMACTYTGEFIDKNLFADLNRLETYHDGIFKEYVERIRNNENSMLSARENPSANPMVMIPQQLCIQDPFEFSKNVSTPVRLQKFEHFISLCCDTIEQLLY